MGNNTDTGIYFPPFSIVHILCQPYARLHQQLAVAQLFKWQQKWPISHPPPLTPSALLATHRIKTARLSFRKEIAKCPGCKSLHDEHSWRILYFVIPALYTVLFFSFWFVTYIMFCLQFCRVSAHAMGLAPLTPSLVLEQKSLLFPFSWHLQILVKLQLLSCSA